MRGWALSSRTQACCLLCNPSVWEQSQEAPWAQWPISIAKSANSKLVRNPDSKEEVDNTWEATLTVFWPACAQVHHMYACVHTHTCAHTYTHICMHTHAYTHMHEHTKWISCSQLMGSLVSLMWGKKRREHLTFLNVKENTAVLPYSLEPTKTTKEPKGKLIFNKATGCCYSESHI